MNGMINWSPGVTLEQIEQQVILRAYEHFRRNKTQTSISLGIAIRTLDSKLERYEKEEQERTAADARRRTENEAFLARARGHHPSIAIDNSLRESDGPASQHASSAANGAEPAPLAAAKEPLSMPQRKEVQAVLPDQASRDGVRRAR